MHQKIADEVREVIADFRRGAAKSEVDGETQYLVTLTGYKGYQHPLGQAVSPVQNFAQRNNMPEILGGYQRPGDLGFGELQDCMILLDEAKTRGMLSKEQYEDKINRIWDSLQEINPELKQIRVKNDEGLFGAFKNRMSTHQKRAAIIGVDDGYNVTDIDFFLNNFLGTKNAMNMNGLKTPEARAYHNLSEKTQQLCGQCFWRPSPQTLQYAQDKALGKEPSPENMHRTRIYMSAQDRMLYRPRSGGIRPGNH